MFDLLPCFGVLRHCRRDLQAPRASKKVLSRFDLRRWDFALPFTGSEQGKQCKVLLLLLACSLEDDPRKVETPTLTVSALRALFDVKGARERVRFPSLPRTACYPAYTRSRESLVRRTTSARTDRLGVLPMLFCFELSG